MTVLAGLGPSRKRFILVRSPKVLFALANHAAAYTRSHKVAHPISKVLQ